ncbi:MAG: hypothetical protein AAF409_03930 [Pseudomonadota bacterium]
MKTLMRTTLAITMTAMALSASPALAKGGDGAEQRAALKAAFAEARANQDQSGPNFFERLFGSEMEGQAEATPKQ